MFPAEHITGLSDQCHDQSVQSRVDFINCKSKGIPADYKLGQQGPRLRCPGPIIVAFIPLTQGCHRHGSPSFWRRLRSDVKVWLGGSQRPDA